MADMEKDFKIRSDSDEAKDPVCGMVVNPDTPYKYHYDGRNYLFCSEKCMYQFMQEPSMYAAA